MLTFTREFTTFSVSGYYGTASLTASAALPPFDYFTMMINDESRASRGTPRLSASGSLLLFSARGRKSRRELRDTSEEPAAPSIHADEAETSTARDVAHRHKSNFELSFDTRSPCSLSGLRDTAQLTRK